MLNAFTVDVEDWFHICGIKDEKLRFENWDKLDKRVTENTSRLLAILKEADAKATFFFLGWIAEKYPELILKVKKDGHEIASHGYIHKLIYEQRPEEFKEDLEKSISIIEGITKEKVIGYRGAGFSLVKDSLWMLKILATSGLKYDSTVFPARRGHGGLKSAPKYPYLLEFENNLKLWEFPISVTDVCGKNIPFSGGGYLRLFPYWFIRKSIKKINYDKKPAIIYIHPREIDKNQPKMKLPLVRQFKYYVGISTAEDKIKSLLSDFKFGSIREVLGL